MYVAVKILSVYDFTIKKNDKSKKELLNGCCINER